MYTVVVLFKLSTVVVFCSSTAGVSVPVTRASIVSVGTAIPLCVSFSQMPIDWAGHAEMTDPEGTEAEGTGMSVGKPVPNADRGRAVSYEMVVVVSFSPTSSKEIPVGTIENVVPAPGKVTVTVVVTTSTSRPDVEIGLMGIIEVIISSSDKVVVVTFGPRSGGGMGP
jgi:hypothetical protein